MAPKLDDVKPGDPALLALVEALQWYAKPHDIGEAQRSLDGGRRAREAITKITERMGRK
ncbi:MAG: hypothetical protein PHX82_15855 [Paracoccaceae bacterium]|jgi:hypothetical protein|nr:hypothetical protein [Paracoccaceae bacterium]